MLREKFRNAIWGDLSTIWLSILRCIIKKSHTIGTSTKNELITELRAENKQLKAQIEANTTQISVATETMSKVLALPTMAKKFAKAKERTEF